jgi:hypothetical protein
MNITQSILHLIPDAQFMCWENDYNRITWNDSNTKSKPSLDELETAWAAVEANEKAMAYKEQRVSAYPPMTDYLDGIVKADNAQVQKYIDDCLAVKAKYPKGA